MYHRFLSHLAGFAIILTVLAGLIFIALGLCLAIFPAFLTVFVRIAGGILALFGLWALIGILGSLL